MPIRVIGMKSLSGAIVDVFVKAFVGRKDAVVAHQQRVAIRCRTRDAFGCDVATGAGTVLDHERRAEQLLHFLADNARKHIAGSAGRERHDQHNRTSRVICRPHRGADRKQSRNSGKKKRPHPD